LAPRFADRERSGKGREIVASRLAGGLSAIGALTLTSSGIAPHLAPARSFGLPEGLTADQFQEIVREAARNPGEAAVAGAAFFAARLAVHIGRRPYVLPMVSANRRLTERLLRR
jgi:hypothetical protein